jgi:hypothetical protein
VKVVHRTTSDAPSVGTFGYRRARLNFCDDLPNAGASASNQFPVDAEVWVQRAFQWGSLS